MMPEKSLSVQGDTLFIKGEVSFDTTAGLIQQLDKLSLEDIKLLDCSGITQSDSAAVGLLLYLQRRDIPLQGVTDSLLGLLDLYDVKRFFPKPESAN
jgi:ABC-type transporter Mla MlaB component